MPLLVLVGSSSTNLINQSATCFHAPFPSLTVTRTEIIKAEPESEALLTDPAKLLTKTLQVVQHAINNMPLLYLDSNFKDGAKHKTWAIEEVRALKLGGPKRKG